MNGQIAHLRGPGTEVLRLVGYRSVREMLPELTRTNRRPSVIERRLALPSSTFYSHAPELRAAGVIVRRTSPGPPRRVFYGLGPAGPEFREVIEGWRGLLRQGRPAQSGRGLDWRAPGHFAEAWAAGVVQALLAGPSTLAQVEIAARPARPDLTGHQIKRLLANLTPAAFFTRDGGLHRISDLGRVAIGELALAARFERRHMAGTVVPVTVEDVVEQLRGSLPLVRLKEDAAGLCEFIVKGDGAGQAMAMAWAEIETGHVVATGVGKAFRPATSWMHGSIEDWVEAVIDRRPRVIRSAGDARMGRSVVEQLHRALFPH
jgi:DNA-binding HxlR family transcriptional regulator